jgi:hypothetical protein
MGGSGPPEPLGDGPCKKKKKSTVVPSDFFCGENSPFCFLFFNILKILEQHGQWNFLEFLLKKSPHFQGFLFFLKISRFLEDFGRLFVAFLF